MRRHALSIHHLPSWQGGDIHQPLCLMPALGAASRQKCAGMVFAAKPADVDCRRCKARLALGEDGLRARRQRWLVQAPSETEIPERSAA